MTEITTFEELYKEVKKLYKGYKNKGLYFNKEYKSIKFRYFPFFKIEFVHIIGNEEYYDFDLCGFNFNEKIKDFNKIYNVIKAIKECEDE